MIFRLNAIKLTFEKRKNFAIHEMDENETKLTDFDTKEIDNIQKKSNVILFSDYTPSDILGIVRVSLLDRPRTLHLDDGKLRDVRETQI